MPSATPEMPEEPAVAARAQTGGRLAVGVSGLYLALYIHYGFFAFLPLWLSSTGASPAEIGLLVSIPLVLRLITVAPFSAWAGRRGLVRDAIALTAAGSAATVLLLLHEPDHAGRIATIVAFSIIWDQIPVLTDAYVVMAVRSRSLDFGRIRVWGSIAVVASNAAAGWAIGVAGIKALPLMIAALLIAPVIVALLLPRDRQLAGDEQDVRGRWRDLLGDRRLLLAMAAVSLIMGSHGVLTSFGVIQWSARGISAAAIGLLQALSVSAEIATFWFGSKLLGRHDPRWLICISALAAMLRWGIMAFDPGIPVLVVAQLLNGATATGAILGIMLVIAERVPAPLSAAAQGLNAVLMGAVLAVATAGSGLLWSYGLSAAYAAMAILAALGAICVWPRRGAHAAPIATAT